MKRDTKYARSCATCKNERPMLMPRHPRCTGCIHQGVCTRWEPKEEKNEKA